MIQYDPHRWLDHLFDLRGTLVKEIGGRVALCVVWSAAIVYIHYNVQKIGMSSVLHSLVGVALGLLLVFRTNSSYDRFWEGRKLWGGITNEVRNLVRGVSIHLADDPELMRTTARWAALYPWTVMATLRGERNPGPVVETLGAVEQEALEEAAHLPMHVAQRLTGFLQEARRRGMISDMVMTMLDANIQQLVDYVGGCERIRNTPLPFAYVVHLRRALMIYCYTLPFALVESYGWVAILDVFFVAYVFFGIEEIGVEIEGPFGNDANDLPMREMCENIQRNVYAMAGLGEAARGAASHGD